MDIKISLLIPTLVSREAYYNKLLSKLWWRGMYEEVELVREIDNGEQSIGKKRNSLMARATGEYACFIDDDDDVSDDYITHLLYAAKSGADCASLKGLYFVNGVFDRPFIHTLKCGEWYTAPDAYYRSPNHLNLIKRDLVKDIAFEEKNFGEDGCWSMEILKQGRIKTQYEIPQTLYFYNARSK